MRTRLNLLQISCFVSQFSVFPTPQCPPFRCASNQTITHCIAVMCFSKVCIFFRLASLIPFTENANSELNCWVLWHSSISLETNSFTLKLQRAGFQATSWLLKRGIKCEILPPRDFQRVLRTTKKVLATSVHEIPAFSRFYSWSKQNE